MNPVENTPKKRKEEMQIKLQESDFNNVSLDTTWV